MDTTPGLTSLRLSSAVGAVIGGVDITRPLSPQVVAALRRALLDHGVIFFQDQDLSDDQMTAFVSQFGTPIPEPFSDPEMQAGPAVFQTDLSPTRYATAVWHSDTTFVAEPPMVTALRAVTLPPVGGDTCWASMHAAYDALSEPLRRMLDGLSAVHSMYPTAQRLGVHLGDRAAAGHAQGAEHIHPVVRVHPETGRKALFVNESATTRIVELGAAESAHILALLFQHVKSPDFAMRWRWTPNDVALWDNRAVQHYAVPDYQAERVMQRVVLAGDRPAGPSDAGGT